MSDRYAVIGNPIAHSKSPRIHALFAAQTGQDILYEAILAQPDGFAAAVAEFVARGGRGMNVTVPFKEQAFRIAQTLAPRAQAASAVNTLAFAGKGIYGDNTDGAGLVRDLTGNLGFSIRAKRVLLVGAGGAARGAIVPLLLEAPGELVIANRTAAKALGLAAEFSRPDAPRITGCGYADLAGLAFDLIINATSAGLTDAPLALPPGLFAPGSLAYDMVYGKQTPFLRQAREGGAGRVADGLGMLVEQAAESFLLWRGLRPDTAPVLAELRLELAI
jgi:shikimate dehydrogenase